MKIVAVYYCVLLCLAFFAGAPFVSGAENLKWDEIMPAGDTNKNWYSVAEDSTGNTILIGVNGGRLYLSQDGGFSWQEKQPAGNADKAWQTVACDGSGKNLIAAVNSGRLYVSSDFGQSWQEKQPAGNYNKAWKASASNSTGSQLLAAVNNGRMYISRDSGVNWSEVRPNGNKNMGWSMIESNSSGSVIIAGVTGGNLYLSKDSGNNWTEVKPLGATIKEWISAGMSSSGSNIIVAARNGRLYISADTGSTWRETQPAGNSNKNWSRVDSDSTGQHLVAAISTGSFYTSSDGGQKWIERWPAGGGSKSWFIASLNAGGTSFLAGVYSGRLYKSSVTTEPSQNEPVLSTVAGLYIKGKPGRAIGAKFGSVKGYVIIADKDTLNASTVKVSQYISSWTDELVLFTVNPGTLAQGVQAYVYVQKSTGEYNTAGYPIIIGGGQADAIAPVIVSSAPKANEFFVPIDTKISLEISDANPGINRSSILLYVNSARVAPAITEENGNLILEYTPPANFNYFQSVSVRIIASDFDGNKLDKSYVFKTIATKAYPDVAWELSVLADEGYSETDVDNTDTIRLLIDGEKLAFSADKIALEFVGRKTDTYYIRNVSIAEADISAGDGKIVAGTWRKVLFDSQNDNTWKNSTVAVLPGGYKTSKPLDFVIYPDKFYYVTFKNISKAVKQTAYPQARAFKVSGTDSSGRAVDFSMTLDWTNPSAGEFYNLSRIYAVNVIARTRRLTVNTNSGGTVTKNPDKPFYLDGERITLQATPPQGYVFAWWSGENFMKALNPLTLIMDSDKTLNANFIPVSSTTYTLTVISEKGGTGADQIYTSRYMAGSVVVMKASSNPQYNFTNWSGDVTGTSALINITMDRDKTITAHYAPILTGPVTSVLHNLTAGLWSGVKNLLNAIDLFK